MRQLLLWKTAFSGGAVATLLLFPLLNALTVDHGYWLHWRTQDTLETLGAWAVLVGVVALTLTLPTAFGLHRWTAAINVLWLLIGGFLAMGALVKSEVIGDVATRYRAASPWIAATLLMLFCILAAMALQRWRRTGAQLIERLTLALSPLVAVFMVQLALAQWYHRDPPGSNPDNVWDAHRNVAIRVPGGHVRTLVLLFDELSRDYLYGSDAAVLGQLPALRRLVAESTVYAGAFLPGGETKLAIPELFMPSSPEGQDDRGGAAQAYRQGSRTPGPGWLVEAVMRGMDVRVFGWHLDYCTGIAVGATECRSVSIYNRRTLEPGFSLLHPLWTTLSLLPADIPFGWFKNAPALIMHRGTSEISALWMKRQLADSHADVVYVHVNVPHVPFLDDKLADGERFVVNRERYVQQLRLVDSFIAMAMNSISRGPGLFRPTRVIVMSDHNARSLTPQEAHEQVVFLVREPDGQNAKRSERRAAASELLAQVLLMSD